MAAEIDMDLTATVKPVQYKTYSGSTTVTPQKYEQKLYTSDYLMKSDVTVNAIPSSMLGGKALMQYISGELVDVTNDDLGGAALTKDQVRRLFTLYCETEKTDSPTYKLKDGSGTDVIVKPPTVLFTADRVRKIDIRLQSDVDFGSAIQTLQGFSNLEYLRLRGCNKFDASTVKDLPVLMLDDVTEFSAPLSSEIYNGNTTRELLHSVFCAPSLQKLNMGMNGLRFTVSTPFEFDFAPVLDLIGVNYEPTSNTTGNLRKSFAVLGKSGSKLEISQGANLPMAQVLFLCFDHPYDITIASGSGVTKQDVTDRLKQCDVVCVPYGPNSSRTSEWNSYWGTRNFMEVMPYRNLPTIMGMLC